MLSHTVIRNKFPYILHMYISRAVTQHDVQGSQEQNFLRRLGITACIARCELETLPYEEQGTQYINAEH